ncbi:MAG TPA: hypothetical protein VLC46_09285 [Thermoanaerobaculia bacterium]|nr:hypothetical protein [Thermoanaerobaculia bacterium]
MRRASLCICLIVLLGSSVAALADDPVPLVNWPVPAASGSSHRFQPKAAADVSNPLVFVPVTPCRVVDTRNPAGPFGGPIFNGGETRSYTVPSGPCTGIPTGIAAVSLNISVTSTLQAGGGFLTAWQFGATKPTAASLTWFGPNQTLSAASIIPTASGGSISIYVGSQTHVIIDINGYLIGNSNPLNPQEQLAITGTEDGSGIIRGQNLSTFSSLITSGVRGVVSGSADTIAGVNGESLNTGANFGVSGLNDGGSTNSAGVLGVSVSRPITGNALNGLPFFAAGVRGENGGGGTGVLGMTNSSATPSPAGMAGILLDSNGNDLTEGLIACRGSNSTLYGIFANGNMGATGTKPFVEPHPTDASKVIRYVALEGPEAGTYFRGRGMFQNGQAVIDVPESFRIVTDTDGLTVQITPIGPDFTMTTVVSANLDQITFRGNRDVEFYYIVHGVRKAYKDWQVIADGTEFVPRFPTDRIPAYLSEEAKHRLIQNGTYNADGSVNMATAIREGWTKAWAARENAQVRPTAASDTPK